MKKTVVVRVVLLLLFAVTPISAQESGEVRVRFANFITEEGTVSITVGNESTAQTDIPANTLSDYFTMPAGQQSIGASIVIGNSFSGNGYSRDFVAGHDYLLILGGNSEEDFDILIDETLIFGEKDPSLARVLFVYGIPGEDVASLRLTTGGVTFAQAIQFPDSFLDDDVKGFAAISLSPGEYSVALSQAGTELTNLTSLTLQPDTDYLVVFTGTVANGIQVIVAENGQILAP